MKKLITPDISNLGTAEYNNRLFFVSFRLRILAIVAAVLFAVCVEACAGVYVPTPIYLGFAGWLIVCLAYMLIFSKRGPGLLRDQENLYLSYYLFGIPFATYIVHYLGGGEWIAFAFYVLDLILAIILVSRFRSGIVTLFLVTSYSGLVIAERQGVIQGRTGFSLIPGGYAGDKGFYLTQAIIVVWFLLLSFCVGLSSRMKEAREKALLAARNRSQARALQFEKMAKELQKKAAENKYIKSATMGYIAKKEYEIERSKQDLAEEVGKMRKTQKAMLFMIEDLNQMSSQLKEARDHLEYKVKERTDELLEISKKLHRSERLAFLGKLSGSVTHELRNPLGVLKNAVYFLEMQPEGKRSEKVSKYLGIIKKELNRIDAIIDDIMGFAKTKSPELKTTNFNDMAGAALANVSIPELIVVKQDLQDIPNILADPELFVHALVNILNNAIMAMNGNGTLIIRTFLRDGRAVVEVEDDGPGIPQDQKELIFEPLYSSKPKGTGLGLPIAKMIVENQSGIIEYDSILGQGTVFRISFPLQRKKRG